MIGAAIFCLGGALQTAAQNLGYLYSGRAVAGLGVGILVMIVPLYQAEIAHPAIRGRITGLQQLMLGIGAAVASKLNLVLSLVSSDLLQHGLCSVRTRATLTTTNGGSPSDYRSCQRARSHSSSSSFQNHPVGW